MGMCDRSAKQHSQGRLHQMRFAGFLGQGAYVGIGDFLDQYENISAENYFGAFAGELFTGL